MIRRIIQSFQEGYLFHIMDEGSASEVEACNEAQLGEGCLYMPYSLYLLLAVSQ